MKNMGKCVKGIALAGIITAGTYLTCLGLNHLRNNREHTDGYGHSVTRPDGAFGHTIYGNNSWNLGLEYDYVLQRRLLSLSSRTIIDGKVWKRNPVNGVCNICGEIDGLVDKIFIKSLGKRDYALYRYKDYDAHKPEFDGADKLLAETKERFKEYLK